MCHGFFYLGFEEVLGTILSLQNRNTDFTRSVFFLQFDDSQNFSKKTFKFDFLAAQVDFALVTDDAKLLKEALASEIQGKMAILVNGSA